MPGKTLAIRRDGSLLRGYVTVPSPEQIPAETGEDSEVSVGLQHQREVGS